MSGSKIKTTLVRTIPILVKNGHRVIVPDCLGFGKSDKFISKYDYSYIHHVDVMKELIETLDLQNATFFGQDWGGLVGLRVVAEMPERFENIVVSNTGFAAASQLPAWFIENLINLNLRKIQVKLENLINSK